MKTQNYGGRIALPGYYVLAPDLHHESKALEQKRQNEFSGHVRETLSFYAEPSSQKTDKAKKIFLGKTREDSESLLQHFLNFQPF